MITFKNCYFLLQVTKQSRSCPLAAMNLHSSHLSSSDGRHSLPAERQDVIISVLIISRTQTLTTISSSQPDESKEVKA